MNRKAISFSIDSCFAVEQLYAFCAFQNLEPLANRCAMRSSSCKILLNGKEDTDLVAKRELVLYVTLPILRFACVGINFVR